MKLIICAIRNRCKQTVKQNKRIKGGSMHHHDEVLMMEDIKKNLIKDYSEDMLIITAPENWREEFDARYCLPKLLSEQNKKAQREKIFNNI